VVIVEVPLTKSGERGIDFAKFLLLHLLVLTNDQGNGKGKDKKMNELRIRRSPCWVLFKFSTRKESIYCH